VVAKDVQIFLVVIMVILHEIYSISGAGIGPLSPLDIYVVCGTFMAKIIEGPERGKL